MDEQHQAGNGDRMDRVERALDLLVEVQGSHHIRLDRIEGEIEGLVGLIRQLAERADARFEEIDRRFSETGEHPNTLTRIVDEIIRKRPPAPEA